jgi:hypothetical protein
MDANDPTTSTKVVVVMELFLGVKRHIDKS